jgi:NAD(P) transhydrogenase
MNLERFDLIVIGSGPAGEKGAAQAAYFGKRVALIEKETVLGGSAANTGTLPSKTLRETALYLSGFRQRELYGIDVRGLKEKVTVRDFLARELLIKESERTRIAENLARHKIRLFQGVASFVDEHTLSVKPDQCQELRIEGDVILIATGSYPYRPPEVPFYDPRIYDSDTILNLHKIPDSMLIVGGGVIGCEYACMFSALGVKVSLVEKRAGLLEFLDSEIARALETQMKAMGIALYLSDSVGRIQPGDAVQVTLQSGAELAIQAVLVSAGRSARTQQLELEKLGIKVDARGRINVNERYQTSIPHIYAAGDVIGNPALASTSMDQARVAMVNAFDLKYRQGVPSLLPYGIFTIPECSMVGETEESLTAKKVDYVVGRTSYSYNARGRIIGDNAGFLKLLYRTEDMRLLGVHSIGEQSTELIHIGLTAILMEARADLFIQACFNYPTLSEMYKYATFDALGQQVKITEARAKAGAS